MPKVVTKEEFLIKASQVHNNKYDYSKVEFTLSKEKVIIICPIHGEFIQCFSDHVHNGHGCNKCGREEYGIRQRCTTKEFIEKAKLKHGDKYDYSLVNYVDRKTEITIICSLHGEFQQRPTNHLNQHSGCFKCRDVGWTKTAWRKSSNGKIPKLYLIICWNENELFYKIGITNRALISRFKSKTLMPYSFRVINYIFSENSDYLYDLEKELHRNNKGNRYSPKIKFNGHAECYKELPNLESIKIDNI